VFISDAGRELSPPLQPVPVSSLGICGHKLAAATANHLPPAEVLFKKNDLSRESFVF